MSEPVTHAEIEDVLTSIRRLVSTNAEASRSEIGGTAQRPAARSNGRLVLTPALRVMPQVEAPANDANAEVTEVSPSPVEDLKADFLRDPQPEPPEILQTASDINPAPQTRETLGTEQEAVEQPAPSVDGTNGTAKPLVLSEVVEEEPKSAPPVFDDLPEAPVSVQQPVEKDVAKDVAKDSEAAAEAVSESAAVAPVIEPAETPEAAPVAHVNGVASLHDAAPVGATAEPAAEKAEDDAPWRDPSATLYAAAKGKAAAAEASESASAERPAPSARVAAVVRCISEIVNAHEAGEKVPGGAHWTDPQNEDDTGALPTKSPEDTDWQDTAEVEAAEATVPEAPALEEPVVEEPALEATVAQEPAPTSGAVADTPDTAASLLSEATVAAVQGQVREQLNDAVETAVQNALPTTASKPQLPVDEAFMDEGALRELVAETVRQELQGALGERITRNVRKLVRREIQRALNSQELF